MQRKASLPVITCSTCWRVQQWRNQTNCIHCGKRLTELEAQLASANRGADTGGCYDHEV